MENMLHKFVFAGAIFLASLTGCSHGDHPADIHGESFVPDDQPTCVGKIVEAQSAVGAKADGMLHDMNFHGNSLNSLGEVKLDLIRKGTPAGDPVVVYLDMPHDQVALREPAVAAYLKTAGLDDTLISMVEGVNPNPTTPTAYNLADIYKADGTSFNGQPNAGAGAAGAGAAAGGK